MKKWLQNQTLKYKFFYIYKFYLQKLFEEITLKSEVVQFLV